MNFVGRKLLNHGLLRLFCVYKISTFWAIELFWAATDAVDVYVML